MSERLKSFKVSVVGARVYEIHVHAVTEQDAIAQVEQMLVTGSVDFSHDLVGFKWEITGATEEDE